MKKVEIDLKQDIADLNQEEEKESETAQAQLAAAVQDKEFFNTDKLTQLRQGIRTNSTAGHRFSRQLS